MAPFIMNKKKMSGSLERLTDKDFGDAIPLNDIYTHSSDDRVGNSGNGGIVDDGQIPGPSSSFSSYYVPTPPPPTLPKSLGNDDLDRSKFSTKDRMKIGMDRYSTIYIFYTTVIQPCLKTAFCLAVITMDVRWDNKCHNVECKTPVYTTEGAVYFMVCLAMFGLSTIQFCIGILLFTRNSKLTRQTMRSPMNCYAAILSTEIGIFILINAVAIMTMAIMSFVLVIIGTEILAMLITCCYPDFHYVPIENSAFEGEENYVKPDDESF